MTATGISRVSSACVPVSITGTSASNNETRVTALKSTNKAHIRHLIGVLVHSYGWTLGQDGNLYAPNPTDFAWGDRVN